MSRIVKLYWDCPYCENHDIDGLVDICPGCGRHKPENTEYHLPGGKILDFETSYSKSQASEQDTVTEKELNDAGMSETECDGNHKEWVCSYCNSLNNWADEYCSSCNSPKSEATYEYGMKSKKTEQIYDVALIKKSVTGKSHGFPYIPEPEQYDNKNIKNNLNDSQSVLNWIKKNIFVVLGSLFFIFSFIFLFWPYKVETAVNGFYWERNISLEEYRTVQESDWDVPPGGRVYDTQTEIRSYVSVIDHYETVTETKSRQVIDHYETSYYYTDNGNGTATEHTTNTPVYKTEYYTETHEEPVYRQEPVYDTKYYYEIERWIYTGEKYASSGNGHEPYWNTEYLPLKENERDIDRTEKYKILYDNGSEKTASLDDWNKTKLGDKVVITKCRLGITYKRENSE